MRPFGLFMNDSGYQPGTNQDSSGVFGTDPSVMRTKKVKFWET